MKNLLVTISMLALAALLPLQGCCNYDVVIVGGTPGGVMTAVSAARMGDNVLLLERSGIVGGLPANGLGATDIATRNATTGLFLEFVGRVKKYYVSTYGENSQQVADCSDGYHFEPHVAELVFSEMIAECGTKVTVLTRKQFDSSPDNVGMNGKRIKWIRITDRDSGTSMKYRGKVFVDATYEGDLGAAAGIPFRTGREGRDEFNEPGAGKIYKYWEGAEDSGSTARIEVSLPLGEGSTGEADDAVQAYNFRLCLTKDRLNRIPFYKPEVYDREEYMSLIDDILDGRNTNHTMAYVDRRMMARNREIILAGGRTMIPGDPWGIAKLTNMVSLPNGKTDANNQHLALISTDLPEENWPWPTADWNWRDAFSERLKNYTLGLFWFASTDLEVPLSFRNAVSEWGFAADEYKDNGGFPRLAYVREGRRFEGDYFFTATDAVPSPGSIRPPVHKNSITASHYALDSHGVRKREPERISLDGFLSYPSKPYTVPYGVITSSKVDNLVLPVPVSGSHIGFSTLRMEPCWMALGQAAGIAAHLAGVKRIRISDVPIDELQDELLNNDATLIYFRDMKPGDEDFNMVQKLGLEGYIPGWETRLDDTATADDLTLWQNLSGMNLSEYEGKTRREVLKSVFAQHIRRN